MHIHERFAERLLRCIYAVHRESTLAKYSDKLRNGGILLTRMMRLDAA